LLRQAFNKIKEELTDHLQTINENTNEINSNYSYLKQIENMITKLNERLDEVELKLSELSGKKIASAEDFQNIVLTPKEREVFLLLYKRNGDLLDYKQIARSLGLTEESIRKHVSTMINKGIPVIKKYFDNKVYLILDSDFSNLQAKKNVLDI